MVHPAANVGSADGATVNITEHSVGVSQTLGGCTVQIAGGSQGSFSILDEYFR